MPLAVAKPDPLAWARPDLGDFHGYVPAAPTRADRVRLNANESPDPGSGPSEWTLNRYPAAGSEALARHLAGVYEVPRDQVLVTRGSDEGIDLLVRGFCRPGDDAVAITPPTFGMYTVAARLQGAEVEALPLRPEAEFAPDWPALTRARARIVFLCSPNNPTGGLLDPGAVLELATRRADRGLVVVDEAYLEFSGASSLARHIGARPNLVVLRTLSKAYGLAGARVGVVLADPRVCGFLRRLQPPYPLPTPSVALALEALEAVDPDARSRAMRVQKRRLLKALAGRDWRLWPGAANFVLVQPDDADALVADAAGAGIDLRRIADGPGLEGAVRISIGSASEMDRLLRFLEDFN